MKKFIISIDAGTTSNRSILFDTKGKLPGGNSFKFDWRLLENYSFSKPFFLSGGISLKEILEIKEIIKSNLPIHAIDVNSKFENENHLKKIDELKTFIQIVKNEIYS